MRGGNGESVGEVENSLVLGGSGLPKTDFQKAVLGSKSDGLVNGLWSDFDVFGVGRHKKTEKSNVVPAVVIGRIGV